MHEDTELWRPEATAVCYGCEALGLSSKDICFSFDLQHNMQ
jgi:hypothetical protein